MLIQVKTERKKNIPLDRSKIQRHEIEPTGLELQLDNVAGSLRIDLTVQGHGTSTIREYDLTSEDYGTIRGDEASYGMIVDRNTKIAMAEYEHLLNVLKHGQYLLHLYSDGTIRMVCKDEIVEK